MERRIRIICSECGSTDVARDAWAMWDEDTQCFELGNVFINGYCFNCDGEASLIEEEIEDATV